MRVIPPIAITDQMMLSSSAPEPGVGEQSWSSSVDSYAIGDRVILVPGSDTVTMTIGSPGVVNWINQGRSDGDPVYFTTTGTLPSPLAPGRLYYIVNSSSNAFNLAEIPDGVPIVFTGSQSGVHTGIAQIHRVFECIKTGGNPEPTRPVGPTYWLEDGPTNRWAMFDLLRNTATQVASPLTVTLKPGQGVDSIALLGLVADAVSITATSVTGGGSVYSYSATLPQRVRSAWSGYAFAMFVATAPVVRFDLPVYDDIEITVSLTRSDGLVSCGALVLGNNVYIGDTLSDPVNDALNFSVIDRDAFGNAILTPRRSVPKTTLQARTDRSNVPALVDLRDMLNAVPAVWAALDEDDDGYFGAFLTLGVYKVFTITADTPDTPLVQLEIEGI